MNHPDLYILRHGETVWNRQHRFQGRKNSPLTAHGKEQAVTQRAILETIENRPTRLFASPQGRAVQTAKLAFGSMNNVTLDDRLMEIHLGGWEGQTREEIRAQYDGSFESGLWNFASPNGESFEMISARLVSFLDDMTEPAIIVTHGLTSIVLRGICQGLEMTELLKLPLDQGCVFVLSDGKEMILR